MLGIFWQIWIFQIDSSKGLFKIDVTRGERMGLIKMVTKSDKGVSGSLIIVT